MKNKMKELWNEYLNDFVTNMMIEDNVGESESARYRELFEEDAWIAFNKCIVQEIR